MGAVLVWCLAIRLLLARMDDWGRWTRWMVTTHPGEKFATVRGRYRWRWAAERTQRRMNRGNEPDDALWFLIPVQRPETRFVDLVMTGRIPLSDIDDYVEKWHEGGGFGMELHEYLGLTEQEYRMWVVDPDVLTAVFRDRRARRVRRKR